MHECAQAKKASVQVDNMCIPLPCAPGGALQNCGPQGSPPPRCNKLVTAPLRSKGSQAPRALTRPQAPSASLPTARLKMPDDAFSSHFGSSAVGVRFGVLPQTGTS